MKAESERTGINWRWGLCLLLMPASLFPLAWLTKLAFDRYSGEALVGIVAGLVTLEIGLIGALMIAGTAAARQKARRWIRFAVTVMLGGGYLYMTKHASIDEWTRWIGFAGVVVTPLVDILTPPTETKTEHSSDDDGLRREIIEELIYKEVQDLRAEVAAMKAMLTETERRPVALPDDSSHVPGGASGPSETAEPALQPDPRPSP